LWRALTRESTRRYLAALVPHKYWIVEGIPVFVRHAGATTLPEVPPDCGRGRPVLCLHGAGGNGGQLAGLLEALAETDSPISFDQPGHGRSGELDSLGSVPRMAAFSEALLDGLGLDSAVLFGHDLGAAVALQCAVDFPGRVAGLVLCGGGPRLAHLAPWLEPTRRITQGKERRAFRREVYGRETAPEVMQRGFMEEVKTDPRVLYGDLLAAKALDLESALGTISAPVLVVQGEDELPAVVEELDALVAALPSARRETLPGGGHMLPLECPEALGGLVASFLGELS